MKAYSNKPTRLDPVHCLYAQIKRDARAAKKAARFEAKKAAQEALLS